MTRELHAEIDRLREALSRVQRIGQAEHWHLQSDLRGLVFGIVDVALHEHQQRMRLLPRHENPV